MRALAALAALASTCSLRIENQDAYGGETQTESDEGIKVTTKDNLHALAILQSNPNNLAFLKVADCWLDRFLKYSAIQHADIHTMDPVARDHVTAYLANHSNAAGRINHIADMPAESSFLQTETEAQWPSLVYMQQFFSTILSHLEKGEDVLHSDLDAVWTKDPWPAMERILKKYPDVSVISMTEDHTVQQRGPQAKQWGFNMNTGFVLFRATKATLNMVRQLKEDTLETGMARRPHEQGALNAYLVRQKCRFANGKGEPWVIPTQLDNGKHDKPMSNWRARTERFKNYATAAVEHYKDFVDEDGLVGSCGPGLKIVVLDNKRFVREPNNNAIVVHPVISWQRNWKADAYERLTTLVPGVCSAV